MAVYFLEKCESYRSSVNEQLCKRREIVCKYLNESYKAGKGRDDQVYKKIVEELSAAGLQFSRSTYQADKVLIRTAYLYLTAESDSAREELVAKTYGSGSAGINYLRRDGIKTWAQLMGMAPPVSTEETTEESETPNRFRLADLQGGPQTIEAITQLTEKLELMLNEDDQLRQENERLTQELTDLEASTADSEAYVKLMENEVASLEHQLREGKRSRPPRT